MKACTLSRTRQTLFKVSKLMAMAASFLATCVLLVSLISSEFAFVASQDAVPAIDESAANDIGENRNEFVKPFFDVLFAQNCVDPPDSCPNENVTFWFYTRSTQDKPSQINITDAASLKRLPYGRGHPWKLIIHGYTGHKDYSPNTELRPAFFQKGEYNIISVDYGPLVREPCYVQSVNNVPLVANCTSQMIDRMVQEGIFKLEELHVIGFSLGGQVSGHLSLFLKSGKLSRVTGLDPALPLFVGGRTGKLDETDAEFVDVIHTNAGVKGKLERSGHVDFYPNGGYSQIGCIETENFTLSGCNHVRAPIYYAESITTDVGFWGVPCHSYVSFYWGWCKAEESELVIMGEYTPVTANGIYYLETNTMSPYALGKQLSVVKIHAEATTKP